MEACKPRIRRRSHAALYLHVGDVRGDERSQKGAGERGQGRIPLGAKGARAARRFPKQSPKVAILVQEDQDRGLARTEVTTGPTSTSR